MEYIFETEGTCAKIIKFTINGNKVTNVQFVGGCHGNLQAISKLVEGMTVEEIEKKIAGTMCGTKGTSCSDQLAKAVREALNIQNDNNN